jgi:arginase
MAVAALTGHGDPDVQQLLPATIAAHRIALVGLHAWTDDDFPHIAGWGHEIVLGLGAEPNGLTSSQARRIVADVEAVADVVGRVSTARKSSAALIDQDPRSRHGSVAVACRL